MRELLGIEVPDDAHGVLQDVHWAGGAFGYFPTYSLGNVIAGQLWEAARAELPDLDEPARRPASSSRCAGFCASASIATGASAGRPRRSRSRSARRSTPGPLLSQLRAKYGELYELGA